MKRTVAARWPQAYSPTAMRCHNADGRCYCSALPPREEDARLWRHFCQTIEWRIEEMRRTS